MTDRPDERPEERLPVPREPSEIAVATEERFTAHPTAHQVGLSPERAAKIVVQSASARWVAFLAVSIVALFVIVYYFYDLGVPGVANSSRLEKEVAVQQVTDVTAGYKLFEANCARCHGAQGQGGIGPVLNDQAKLLTHLTPAYLANVLTVGGRFVCGDANSLMPVWSDQGNPPGPLNYRDIEELVAFIRAPSSLLYEGIDPATGLTTPLSGWRDPAFAPAAGSTPVPNCWKDAFASPSAAPSAGASAAPSAGASAAPTGSAAPSAAPAGSPAASGGTTGVVLELTASGVAFDKTDLTAPAGAPFQIKFTNNDAGIPHNVAIHKDSPTGEIVWQGEIFSGVDSRTYDVPALPAGTYGFSCVVHPNMTGTLTVK
jgi:plastocyanin/mono/diheme cytochrome c family protein